jgi:hypothetical protein
MSNIRIHENGFEIRLNDIVVSVFEYTYEL